MQAAADLARLAQTDSALSMMTWTERQTRRAADIMTELARADAKAAYEAALKAKEFDPSVIVPAVPLKEPVEDDLKEILTVRVDLAADAASDAKRAADRAAMKVRLVREQMREARRSADRETYALLASDLTEMKVMAAKAAEGAAHLADHAERLRIETFGYEDVAKKCRAASVRGAMRRLIDATDAHVSAILGLLGGPKRFRLPSRVSDWSMIRAQEMAALNRGTLAHRMMVLRDRDGVAVLDNKGSPKAITALDAARHGEKIAKAQRYAMCLGIQQLAEARGWTLVLLTTTLPPEWHAHPTLGRPSYNPDCDPISARDELQARCHRSLALCSRRDIRFLAPRAREGQVDGTPHDHIAAFVRPEDVDGFIGCFAEHFPEQRELMAREADAAGDHEKGARLRERLARIPRDKRVACHARVWEAAEQATDRTAAGTIASYIFGYASKSMADAIDGDDDAARNAVWAHQRRVRRWAVLGFRRGIIGQWQRIQKETERPACPVLGAVWQAMQEHRWGDALELLDVTKEQEAAPLVYDYEERRGLAGVARRVPLALRAAGPVSEVEERDGLFLGRTDGFRYRSMSAAAWEEEQNGGRPKTIADYAYEISMDIDKLTPPPTELQPPELTPEDEDILTQLESEWAEESRAVAVIERFPRATPPARPAGRQKTAADVFETLETTLLPLIAARKGNPAWADWIQRRRERLACIKNGDDGEQEGFGMAA